MVVLSERLLPCCVAVQVIETDQKIADIHANSESFDSKAELSFKYLQVRRAQQMQGLSYCSCRRLRSFLSQD
jgi:hypothetical protein